MPALIFTKRVSSTAWAAFQHASTVYSEPSASIRRRVARAYYIQIERNGKSNAELSAREVDFFCKLDTNDQALLNRAMDKLKLSARAYHRILKLARTIADVADSAQIETPHLSEAISYRNHDRFNRR